MKNAADELDGVIRDVRARCGILTQRRIRDIEMRLIKVEKYTEDTFKLEEGNDPSRQALLRFPLEG